MSDKFNTVEVVGEFLNVPAGTILKLSDAQAQDRAHVLTRHGSQNGVYRALKAVSFKPGETFETTLAFNAMLATHAVVNGKSPAESRKDAEEKPGSVPVGLQNRGPEVEAKEAKTKAKQAAAEKAKADKAAADKGA